MDVVIERWSRLPARLRLVVVLVLVVLVGAGAARRASRTPWGPPVAVVVATADTPPGHPVTTMVRSWPADLVPDDALATSPPDAVAARTLRADAVVTQTDVAEDLDDLLGPNEVAIALAQALPDLPTDARVVLLGTGLDGTGARLAGGRLLTRSADWTWVAVDRGAAPTVAAALSTGQVTVALAPP